MRALAAAAAALALMSGCGPAYPEPDVGRARQFDKHALYWVGPEFEGLPLTHANTEGSIPGFSYGDCDASSSPCALPLDIQVTPLCRALDAVSVPDDPELIRGAPVGRSDSAPVLLTRTVQIKVYAYDDATARRALVALRSFNDVAPIVSVDDPFPPPPPGVVEGTRPCAAG